MNIFLITPFPQMSEGVLRESILGRAQSKGSVTYHIINLFDFTDEPHHRIDDAPFGGGSGMVMLAEPLNRAFEYVQSKLKGSVKVVFPTPDGRQFSNSMAQDWAALENLVFISGHYKGIDQRVRNRIVSDEVSIGDFVLTGGELPALMMTDAVVRLIPGVLGSYESAETDSFMNGLLDYPHYTRPAEWQGEAVPDVLLSGHHKMIEEWRLQKSELKTKNRRPDLWSAYKIGVKNGQN